MILAGIDEAGYGPLLGPLVVGCCAFDLGASYPFDAPLPCLWERFSKLVSKKRSTSGKKLHVNDSKLVYSSSGGLHELERSVLAFLAASGSPPADFAALLARVAENVLDDLPQYPWYQPDIDQPGSEQFPFENQGISISMMGNALRGVLDRSSTPCIHYSARVILERRLNQLLAATRNKASVLFSTSAIHLDYLLNQTSAQHITIFCDRQGGRERYDALLRLMFEDWSMEIVQQSDGRGEYILRQKDRLARLIFAEKAETQCLPVALASMLSKYLREGLMRRFNAYWVGQLPGVAPTAGYYGDGTRFLADIESRRRELGIADEHLIRSR